jgi:hypothetical protein
MEDLFETNGRILLQSGTDTVPYSFTFPVASSATANDGSIPFESTISSAVVKAFDANGVDRTTEMIVSSSVISPVVTVSLKYPATTKNGRYYLEFILTLNTGAKMEFNFTRILVKD